MGNIIEHAMFPVDEPFNKLNTHVKTIDGSQIEYIHHHYHDSKNIILYSHGNYETLDDIDGFLKVLSARMHMSVVSYEYPDNSTAEKSKKTIETVYSFVETLYAPEDIILFGRSIGSGPTMHMADLILANRDQNGKVDCVVLVSPLSNIKSKVSTMGVCGIGQCFSSFVEERFDNSEIVKRLNCPLLLIHGKDDKILPCEMSKELFCLYGGEKKDVKLVLVKGKDHNTVCRAKLISKKIIEFRETNLKINKNE